MPHAYQVGNYRAIKSCKDQDCPLCSRLASLEENQ